ncbi:MAG TPA: DMT family transporter [Candidatus Limnocylindria bacterium]|nr:DMT family transporter [Candidatus Limnocylindria bacterium]
MYGIGAAVAFGFGDYAAAMATRRAGFAWTALAMQVIGNGVLVVLLLALGRWPAFLWSQVPWAFALALIGTVSLVLLYRAFALGPIAVVSPVVASYAALTVIGIVVFLGERLTAGESVAIAVTFVGVAIASTDFRELRETLGRPSEGVRLGILATLGFAVWGVVLTAATRSNETFALVVIWRCWGIALMTLFVLWKRAPMTAILVPSTLAIVALVGVLDTAANVLLMLGIESGYASYVMTGSGAYPLIPAVLAILVLRERLAPNQYAGVAILIAGLVALGLQS